MWTLPNILTLSRIVLAPVIALLPFINGWIPKLVAFIVFLAAAITDFYDGRLARRRKQISDIGKELDPLADKLLLLAALIPIYWMTTYGMKQYEIPWWGSVPLWVAAVLVGREAGMTAFRVVARRRGVIIAAMGPGKLKTVFQDIFLGATIGWFAWKDMRAAFGWQRWWVGIWWENVHGTVIALTMAVAVILTVYSMLVYIHRYRALFRSEPSPVPPPVNGP